MTAYLNSGNWASLAQAQQQQQAYNSYNAQVLAGLQGTTTTNCTMYLGNNEVEPAKVPEPSKFKKLSNHKFHELLDKFAEMI